ncbi:MAG: hypothetical protein RR075_00020 [Pygmaiobacter sp.]
MKQLDENGVLQEADGTLFCGQSEKAAAWLQSTYPCAELGLTNLAARRTAFCFTVLANAAPQLLGNAPDYLRWRTEVDALAACARLRTDGLLVLDQGAGHELYRAQHQGAQQGGDAAFGRCPIVVQFEYTTGTILCEGSALLAAALHQQFGTAGGSALHA